MIAETIERKIPATVPLAFSRTRPAVALLTGGADRPYAVGLATALSRHGLTLDVVGSDEVSSPALLSDERINFLNLRDQSPGKSTFRKLSRITAHYIRLGHYAAVSRAPVFHILWSNRLEWFDRTLLLLYYRVLGKRLVFTAHNVNSGKRDGNDSFFNRLTLRIQYRLVAHIFVHTERMKNELLSDFGVPSSRVSVIPFGINDSVPNTSLASEAAKEKLGLAAGQKALLFYGNIAPYKGLEILARAFKDLARESSDYRLIIAGRKKGSEAYWQEIERELSALPSQVIKRIEFIPDDETELYFKAADVLILPYTHIFQSGVLFLGYNFGLPAIAADVGSLRDEIVDGETGFVFRSTDAADLARQIREYFESDLYRELPGRRAQIRGYARERYSWSKVASATSSIYSKLLAS